MRLHRIAWWYWLLLVVLAAPAEAAPTSCEACHGNPDWFPGEPGSRIVDRFGDDVHAAAGLSCHDCHGGNPAPELAADYAAAMDPDHAANPYRGRPARKQMAAFCGRCHSDPITMRRFDPSARVDQEKEYATNQHGLAVARGDQKVATCVDCHSAHGILAIGDSRSPVHPTRVAETCAGCHADPVRMAGYKTRDGGPLPVDQYAGWRSSVHAMALFERGDLSAPTCNDCHGNHGAAPPGVESLAFVCGQCHGREARLFQDSPKHAGFERHNELYLAEGAACPDCHVSPEPQSELVGLRRFTECATCHGNHLVLRPTVAMLSPLPETPCALCHEGPEVDAAGEEETEAVRVHYEETRDELMREASGLEGQALFDWLVDRLLALPAHHRPDTAGQSGRSGLLPSFTRLFERFRVGKTRVRVRVGDGSGGGVERSIVRCDQCHAEAPVLAGTGNAFEVSDGLLRRMRQLSVLSARSDRTLLAARRGGVEVRDALTHLDHAVDAQIELQALVHGFRSDPDSPYVAKQAAGMEHARAALARGREALADLESRRRGLGVALVVIVLVLIGLGLKIRQLSARSTTPG